MKRKGVIRRVDNLGRIVLPIHFRKHANIYENDDVLINMDEDGEIIISKHQSFEGQSKFFTLIALSIYQILKGTIIIVDENKIVSSYGKKENLYRTNIEISDDLKNRMKREPSILPSFYLINEMLEEDSTYVHHIYSRHGIIIGAIIYIYEKDLLENVSQIISSYAIFISEMLKNS